MKPLGSRWDAFVWPRWLPVSARLPLIAQIAAVVMLGALIADPWWTALARRSADVTTAAEVPVVPKADAVGTALPATPSTRPPKSEPLRPAHLNLDVRHSLRNVELTVTVDGERALQTHLEGSNKKFGVFGKRAERGFTRTLDLDPGVRVVRVRMRSGADKFDQTRVERFDLGSAAVAGLSITADKSGLSLAADRPVLPATAAVTTASSLAPAVDARTVEARAVEARAAATAADTTPQAADVFITELFKTLRQVLLAIAGFIASAATGFVVQEFMRARKKLIFAEAPGLTASGIRRRRRDNDQPQSTDISAGAAG
jgi:hypothetical protein